MSRLTLPSSQTTSVLASFATVRRTMSRAVASRLSKKHWVLCIEFTCPELKERVNNEDMSTIYSAFTTDFFVTVEARKLKSESDLLDRFRLDDSVQEMVREINAGEEFRILGWFKPASDEEGTAVENKKFHIAALFPEKDLTVNQMTKKYKGEGRTAAPQTTDGSG